MSEATTVDVTGMQVIYRSPEAFTEVPMRYCPGCTHGIAHRLVAGMIDELGIRDRTITIASVGCSVYAYEYFNTDAIQAAHGRAPAVATGIKRVRPDNIVFSYQGDGDLASIGIAEVLHAAARAENITIIFLNNAIFGMTQGQMAPTTLLGQKTTTTPLGRTVEHGGYPINVCELMQGLPGMAYLARETLISPRYVNRAKRSIAKAFRTQMEGLGLSLVELVSSCPVWWGVTPLEALKRIEEEMLPQYPLKVFVDKLTAASPAGGEADA